MAQNPIQFQKSLSLRDFLKEYGTEEQCEQKLEQWRWPLGFICPSCGRQHESVHLRTRALWQCRHCHHQASLTAGTIFEATKLPLTTWFLAMFLLTQQKNGISALALKRHLVVSYLTAWRVKHKLQQVMKEHP
jgi:ribosomal protein L37AE/L43A